MAFYDKKKPFNESSDFPTSPETDEEQKEQEDNESDAFAKWVKDKLRSDKRRMVEIE